MGECIADPSTTARWSAAMESDKIVPQWSLRQSCLCTVKDSVLGWSRGRRNSVTAECPERNPFLEYPIGLRHELLQQLLRLRPTGRELLKAVELLLQSGLPAFDLGCLDDCKFNDVQNILLVLIRTGSCLRELSLAGQWLYHDAGRPLLQQMLRACPNLHELTLQHTTAEGRELLTALRHCPNLRRLEILHPSLDEPDVDDLSDAMSDDPAFDAARCNLTELRLPSSVNGRALLKLLQVLPNLQYISCAHLDPMIDELEATDDQTYWRERTSRLRGLHVSLPVCEDTTELLIDWFPNLEEISLEVQEDMDLRPLAKLKRLTSLELKNSPTLPLSYVDVVLPLLTSCGNKLLSLSLERFDLVDLAATSAHCPHLRYFSTQWFSLLSAGPVQRGQRRERFSELRHLRLRPRVHRKVTPEACELLLTHCTRLRHLEFYCSYGLNDVVVNKLLKTNRFDGLRTLLLRHGHGLSAAGLRQITRASQLLRVWDVGMTPSKQADEEPPVNQ